VILRRKRSSQMLVLILLNIPKSDSTDHLKTNALYRDAKPTIVNLIAKAHWHYLSNDPSKTAAPSPLPRLKRS
jgi:hypothetical protein